MPAKEEDNTALTFDKSDLRERLTLTQYQVTQEHHTERSVYTLRERLTLTQYQVTQEHHTER